MVGWNSGRVLRVTDRHQTALIFMPHEIEQASERR